LGSRGATWRETNPCLSIFEIAIGQTDFYSKDSGRKAEVGIFGLQTADI
jgi:hypothetical protein